MTCVRRNLNNRNCCNSWQKGIRTINNQYPDDNREFEIAAGNGISVVPITAGILITNTAAASTFIEGRNIDIVPSGGDLEISVEDQPVFDGLTVDGTSTFNGDIIQNGAAYETHAEKIYTTNDYVIMRDGAVAGLAAGDYSGFQVKLYDGVNDGRLVIDNSGTARVGDVGDEQPLLTRDESADLTDTHLLQWDAANFKAIDAGTDVSAIMTAIAGKEDKIAPIYSTMSLASFGFTYGNLRKWKISDKVYLLTVWDALHSTAGVYTVDTSLKNSNAVISVPLYDSNTRQLSGALNVDSGGVKIVVWNGGSWCYGSSLVVVD